MHLTFSNHRKIIQSVKDNMKIGNCQIELKEEDDRLLGLGAVSIGDTQVRSGEQPMFAQLRTPFGVEFVNHRLTGVDEDDGSTVLRTTAEARQGPIMEWMLHECRPRVATDRWGEPPQPVEDMDFSMTLAPVERTFGSFEAQGFSYHYSYSCPSHPIHMITDHGSWEPGGAAKGNTVLLRGNNPPVTTINDVSQRYSSEWYLPEIVNPNIFQFKPLQTGMQGFTLTVGRDGALVTWATRVAHIRTLLEKQRGSQAIEHWHEHCADLGPELTTAPMEVLWIPGDFSDQGSLANLYYQVYDHVAEELHRQADIRRERVTTYATMEEWDLPDVRSYIDDGLPKVLEEVGVKTVMIPNWFQNDMNTYGVSNMCCTVDYQVAESVGEDRFREFCAKVHAGGAEVQMWGNTAISSLAVKCSHRNGPPQRIDFLPLEGSIMDALKEAETPFVRNPFGAREADHYSPSFCQLNLRDPVVRGYWHSCWRELHEDIGVDGIFLDSSFNMTSDKFHWSYWPSGSQEGATIDQIDLHGYGRPEEEPPPEILSQYHVHLDLIREMQSYGYTYSGEDTGVFGLSRSGSGVTERMKHPFMWSDSYCQFDPRAIEEAGADPDRVFFEGLAHRLMWNLFWLPQEDKLCWVQNDVDDPRCTPTEWQIDLLNVYNEVEADMRSPAVVNGGGAVLYRHDGGTVVWAVEQTSIDFEEEITIEDLVDGTTQQTDRLACQPLHVYRVI